MTTQSPAGLSRVELEAWRCRLLELGDDTTADAIATELASRTWQNINPYAAWPYSMYDAAFSDDYE